MAAEFASPARARRPPPLSQCPAAPPAKHSGESRASEPKSMSKDAGMDGLDALMAELASKPQVDYSIMMYRHDYIFVF